MSWWGESGRTDDHDTDSRASWGNSGSTSKKPGCELWLVLIVAVVLALIGVAS